MEMKHKIGQIKHSVGRVEDRASRYLSLSNYSGESGQPFSISSTSLAFPKTEFWIDVKISNLNT